MIQSFLFRNILIKIIILTGAVWCFYDLELFLLCFPGDKKLGMSALKFIEVPPNTGRMSGGGVPECCPYFGGDGRILATGKGWTNFRVPEVEGRAERSVSNQE